MPVESVLDVGCGLKGMIAQNFWESEKHISVGYACDRHVLKPMSPPWVPMLMDVEDLDITVDVTTHCGMLEHVEYEKALRILRKLETVTKKLIFFSASAELREVDYKVRRDSNPYHYYRSFWGAPTFEALGYTIDRQRMVSGETFQEEAIGWVWVDEIKEPWEVREARARAVLASRRCSVPECKNEPIVWDGRVPGNVYYCANHYVEKYGDDARDVRWWLDYPSIDGKYSPPPWRKEKLQLRVKPVHEEDQK